ncbi:cytochrome P450 [Ilyonectria destructans]|nr:cytochrome P450 [Ilyonectria destructans]
MLALVIYDANLVYAVGALLAVTWCVMLVRLTSRWTNAPPGPPTIPLLGNLHQIPKRDLHLQYDRWAKEYGPIYSLKLGSQNVVVLASGEMIKNVVDKRSGNYADRPDLYMQEVWEGSRIIMRGYDALWKVERKLYHQFLNINKAARYAPYQDLETRQLCYDLLSNPDDFENLITRSTLSVATSMAYGFRVLNTKSKVMQELLTNTHGFFVMVHNSRLLDWYTQLRPIARILPLWLNSVASKGKLVFRREKAQFRQLYEQARQESEVDGARPSFAADISTAQKTWKDVASQKLLTDHAASYIAGIAMEGGADTTSNTLAGLIKAMMLFPDVQRKAQQEIDSVVGTERIPSIDDFENLPYIRQTVKEALRWLPTSISGAIPHAALADDEIDGFTIPAGTTIVLAVWSVNNDPKLFPDPRRFDPSRHDASLSLGEAAAAADFKHRDNWTFGAGRRICPGIHVAERTLFLAVVRLLWAFQIDKARGPDGEEIQVDRDEVTQSIAARPVPFRCSIKPRSEKHIAIVKESWKNAADMLDATGNYKEVMIR